MLIFFMPFELHRPYKAIFAQVEVGHQHEFLGTFLAGGAVLLFVMLDGL